MPLKLHGEIIGLLYADNRIDKGKFTDDSIRLLAPLADQTAGAIALERATGYSASAAAPSLATIDRNGAQRTPRRYEFLPIAEWPDHPTSTGFSDLAD
ncbi:MAG: GAF domain-containing protein [Burkholderiales bacterium]|nr:GAF domain-containing protein [Anaerolineae bacterium]